MLSSLKGWLSSPQTLRAYIKALVATGHIDAALQGWRFVVDSSVGRDSDYIFDLAAAGATALVHQHRIRMPFAVLVHDEEPIRIH